MPKNTSRKISRRPSAPAKISKKVSKKVARKPVTKKRIGATKPFAKPAPSTALPKKRLSLLSSLGFQVFIAGSAATVLLVLGMVGRGTFATHSTKAAEESSATIHLEHMSPLSLTFLIARKGQAAYATITNDSPNTIRMTLPGDWQRLEVLDAQLKDVTADFPTSSTVRWVLPGRASIRLLVRDIPHSVSFTSTSVSTAAVTVKSVDLPNEQIRTDVLLLKSRATTTLWDSE